MKQLSLLPELERDWTSDDCQTPNSVAIAVIQSQRMGAMPMRSPA